MLCCSAFAFCSQALRSSIGNIAISLIVTDLLVHADENEDKLAGVRKVCNMLAQELGHTRADLPDILQQKLEEFQKSGDAAAYLGVPQLQTPDLRHTRLNRSNIEMKLICGPVGFSCSIVWFILNLCSESCCSQSG